MSSYINQLAKRKQSHGRVWACVILCSINMHLEKILFTITTKWHEKELYAFVVITLKSKDEQSRRVTVKPSQHEHTFIFSFAFINSASKKRPWPISANLNVLTYIKIKEEKKRFHGRIFGESIFVIVASSWGNSSDNVGFTDMSDKKTLSLPQQMIGRNNYDITLFSFKYLFTSRRGGKRTSLALFLLDTNSL